MPEPDDTRAYIDAALTGSAPATCCPGRCASSPANAIVGQHALSRHRARRRPRRDRLHLVRGSAGSEATSTPPASCCCLTHAFDSLGCRVVGLRTDNFNFNSQRAIEALGAKKDGVIRHHHPRRDGTRARHGDLQHPRRGMARREATSGATIGSSRRVIDHADRLLLPSATSASSRFRSMSC